MTRFVTATTSQGDAINAVADLANQNALTTRTAKTDGAATLTVAEFINGVVAASGANGAYALTYPTAAAIVAAMENAQVGSSCNFCIINNNNNTVTLTTNTGLTLAGTAAVPTTKTQLVKAVVTNATSGAEAVTIQHLLVAPI